MHTTCTQHDTQHRYGYYHSQKGFTKEAALTTAGQVYGRNSFDMPLPQFFELLKEQMLAPFFVFQVFCVGLWCLDEYWYVVMRAKMRKALSVVYIHPCIRHPVQVLLPVHTGHAGHV